MRRILVLAMSLVILGNASAAAPSADRAKDVSYRDCLVQELRAPMPKGVFINSMPPDWEPVPYEGSGRTATHGGTILSCEFKGKEVEEMLWWTLTVPPKRFRDPSVDAYAFLLTGMVSPSAPLGGTVRRCLGDRLATGEIAIEEVASFPRSLHTSARWDSGNTDESYVEVDQRAPLPANRMRIFYSYGGVGNGYSEGAPIHAFDVIYSAEDGEVGPAVFGQNVGEPSIDGLYFYVPGFWSGDAIVFEGDAFITGSGRHTCS